MPTYIALLNWTEQGIANIRETLEGAERAAERAQAHGARLERLYWTMGPYDLVGILEAPDDETASAFTLEPGSRGGVRTTTLRAYNREEMSGILERLG